MSYQENLKKAREEYKKTGIMTPERACVLLNCSVAVKLFEEFCDDMIIPEKRSDFKKLGIDRIKQVERKVGIRGYINSRMLVATTVYFISRISNVLREPYSRKEIIQYFNIKSLGTLSQYLRKYLHYFYNTYETENML